MKNRILRSLIAAAIVVCMAFSLSACVGSTSTASTAVELTVSEEMPEPDMANYTDDYDGLVQYLKDCELLAGDGSEMSADYIGAKTGEKFTYNYNGKTINCELYYFDPADLNETAQKNIAQLKENGTFASLNDDVPALLSKSEKFMMIYVNNNEEDEQVSMKNRMEDKFTNFVGGK